MTSQENFHEPAKMSLREQWAFVRGPLHSGTVNKAMHFAGLVLLVWGATSGRLSVLVLGLVLPALGHGYDKMYRFDATTRARARQVVWLQLVATGAAFVPLYFLYAAFRT